jgi:hypothetical protein
VADARRGLAILGSELERVVADGMTYWFRDRLPSEVGQAPVAALLQAFDEYIVGYQATRTVGWDPNSFANAIVIDGQVVGQWRRVRKPSSIVIETRLSGRLSTGEQEALEAEVERYARFVGVPATIG